MIEEKIGLMQDLEFTDIGYRANQKNTENGII